MWEPRGLPLGEVRCGLVCPYPFKVSWKRSIVVLGPSKSHDVRFGIIYRIRLTTRWSAPYIKPVATSKSSPLLFVVLLSIHYHPLLGKISKSLLLLIPNCNLWKFWHDGLVWSWQSRNLGSVRLKQVGARIKHVPLAVGYHWHPAFSMDQIPKLINQVLLLSLELLDMAPVSPISVCCHTGLHFAITFT